MGLARWLWLESNNNNAVTKHESRDNGNSKYYNRLIFVMCMAYDKWWVWWFLLLLLLLSSLSLIPFYATITVIMKMTIIIAYSYNMSFVKAKSRDLKHRRERKYLLPSRIRKSAIEYIVKCGVYVRRVLYQKGRCRMDSFGWTFHWKIFLSEMALPLCEYPLNFRHPFCFRLLVYSIRHKFA